MIHLGRANFKAHYASITQHHPNEAPFYNNEAPLSSPVPVGGISGIALLLWSASAESLSYGMMGVTKGLVSPHS